MAKKQAPDNNKLIVENRRARYDYSIEDVLECGIILMGSEVKALRIGSANIAESYVDIEKYVEAHYTELSSNETTKTTLTRDNLELRAHLDFTSSGIQGFYEINEAV